MIIVPPDPAFLLLLAGAGLLTCAAACVHALPKPWGAYAGVALMAMAARILMQPMFPP